MRKSLKFSKGMSPHKIFEISPSVYNTFRVLPERLQKIVYKIHCHLPIRRNMRKVLDDCFKKYHRLEHSSICLYRETTWSHEVFNFSLLLGEIDLWFCYFCTLKQKVRLDENQKKIWIFFSPGNCLPSAVLQMQICPFVDQRGSSFEVATKQSRHQRCSTKVMICKDCKSSIRST